jgi:hypothetical protein
LIFKEKNMKIPQARQGLHQDPFDVLSHDVQDYILQHLKGEEILEITTVSYKWNQIIGSSPTAMKKIKVELPATEPATELKTSDRRYQNLSVAHDNDLGFERDSFLMHRFASSLVELEINHNQSRNIPELAPFPKLLSLKLAHSNTRFISSILKNQDNLRSLSIDVSDGVDEEFIAMLMQKEKLKSLTLTSNHEELFKFKSIREPEFKLTSLSVNCFNPDWFISAIPRLNFNRFVLAMADTLTSLDIHIFQYDNAALIQKLPALKSLKMHEFSRRFLKFKYKRNTTIETLHCYNFYSIPLKFLVKLKGVRKLIVDWFICGTVFREILENMPGLKQIEVNIELKMKQDDFVRRIHRASDVSKSN